MKELFNNILSRYKVKGHFSFKPSDSLQEKCNAPTDQNGIYLIFKITDSKEDLLYIGSSGQMRSGVLTVRASGLGGMKDRIVNGYHPKFGKVKRKKAFPEHMRKDNISELIFYWWVTWDEQHKDIPSQIERRLRDKYLMEYNKLPEWHK